MRRILHIVGNMAPDGMSNFIMNIYRRMDRSRLQFDFIVMGEKHPNYHDEIAELGGRVYRIPRMAKRPVAHFREIKRIVREGGYDLVFRHTDTCTVAAELIAARMGGAGKVIPHAHSTRALHPVWNALMRPVLNLAATERFACGKAAGDWLFGGAPYRIVHNGIDLERFAFDKEQREAVRKEYVHLKDSLLFGHIGNFFTAKNHLFLLEVFAEIKKRQSNAVLLLIGDGELRSEIEEKIRELELENSVKLLGERNDVDRLIQGLDCLIFPSFYEGLPIALIEAQAAGLPVVYSDVISDEVRLTAGMQPLPLSAPAEAWADRAIALAEEGITKRKDSGEDNGNIAALKKAGYDLETLVSFYENFE